MYSDQVFNPFAGQEAAEWDEYAALDSVYSCDQSDPDCQEMTNRTFFKIYAELYCVGTTEPCKIPKDFDMWSLIYEKEDPNFNKDDYAQRQKDGSGSPDYSTSPDNSTSPDASTDKSPDASPTGGSGRRL